jgi:hypothetical protein
MNRADQTNRPRTPRPVVPERVREVLHAYRRRATRYSTRTGESSNQDTRPAGPRRSSSTR